MQQVGQLLEVPFNFPSSAVDLAAKLRRNRLRKVGDQDDLGLAIAGRFVQPQHDPSQAIAASLAFRVIDPDRLLEDLAGLATSDKTEP